MNRFSSCLVRSTGIAALAVAAVFSSGCMQKMALTKKTQTPILSPENGVVLLVIETSKDKVGALGRLPVVSALAVAGSDAEKATTYSVPMEVVSAENNVVTHLVSLSLAPGEYEIERIAGIGLTGKEVGNSLLLRRPLGNFGCPINLASTIDAGRGQGESRPGQCLQSRHRLYQ